MRLGEPVIGVIVLSSLGYGKFDEEDRRLLEVLASHAAVAFENAEALPVGAPCRARRPRRCSACPRR